MSKIELPKKAQKQYDKLKKLFKISKREFLEYYKNVRKANKKTARKQFKQKTIYQPKYSLTVNYIKTREDFLQYRRSVKRVLQRGYTQDINKEMRNRAYQNIRNVLGRENAKPVIERLKQLTDEEYVEFFKENEDIESIGYDSDQTLFDFIDITKEKFLNRLEER